MWAHLSTAAITAFLASLVEFVEALTIVLAVGVTRGWRAALSGVVLALVLLVSLVAVCGRALAALPFHAVQLAVGVLLLIFGVRWLKKAVLRSAGVLPMHDEAAIYSEETGLLGGSGTSRNRSAGALDVVAVATSFKAVALEGLEVVFIVLATGAGGQLIPACIGAAAAGILVVVAGIALRHPLTRVPENTLKYAVGVLLTAFGLFWTVEGIRGRWPGGDAVLLALAAAVFLTSRAARHVLQSRRLAGR